MSAPPQRLMPRSMQTLRRLQANHRIRPTGPARLCRGPCQVGSTVTGRNETETTRVERPATQDNSQVSRCFKQNGNGYDMICMIWPLVAVALAASASNRQPGGRRRQQAAAERSRGANRPRSVATVINAKSRKKNHSNVPGRQNSSKQRPILSNSSRTDQGLPFHDQGATSNREEQRSGGGQLMV